jgi:hypothetical protein
MSSVEVEHMTTNQRGRRSRMHANGAATAGAVTDVGYLRLIAEQATGAGARVVFVAAFIAGMTVLAIVGAILLERRPAVAQAALLAAAAGLAGIGYISLFSIGSPLLLAAVLAGLAIPFVGVPARWVAAPVAGSIAVLVVGLIAT